MDYFRLLNHLYPNKNFFCKDTYESIEWRETDIAKPTKQELCDLYESVKDQWELYEMRIKRNMLLMSCDFRSLPDYPDREKWIIYRQKLRDFPSIWVSGMDFPIPPE
jgi:hypothetical protein